MELQQPCKHRDNENCELNGRPCYGAKRDETGAYKVDFWTERTCPNYVAVEAGGAKVGNPQVATGGEVVVRIFGPADVKEGCGDDCVAETVELQADILRGFFKRRYGDKVRVDGFDIASEVVEEYPEVKEFIKKGASTVVMVNDEVKLVGGVDLEVLKQEIGKLGVEELRP